MYSKGFNALDFYQGEIHINHLNNRFSIYGKNHIINDEVKDFYVKLLKRLLH